MNPRRLALALTLTLALAVEGPGAALAQTSTIDPTVPASTSTLSSAPVRKNFAAAANDINALYSGLAATNQALSLLVPKSVASSGLFVNLNSPPTTLTNWLNTALVGGKNPYGYLGQYGQLVVSTNYGQMAIVGASRTSDVVSPATCCSMGLSGVAINNNTAHPQTAWPQYLTGARLAGTGAIQNESDIANVSNDIVDINPYLGTSNGPPGTSVNWALSPGGEPPVVGSTPNGQTSGIIIMEANGQTTRHPLVFATGLFNSGYCTTNCPAIDVAKGYEIRQSYDGSDQYGSFVRFGVDGAPSANGLAFTDNGAIFQVGSGQIMAVIVNASPSTNWPYIQLSATVSNAVIAPGTGNGATLANLELSGLGAGAVIQFDSPPKFASSTTGSGTQTFTNSPCSGLITDQWIPVQIAGHSGTWNIPACQ